MRKTVVLDVMGGDPEVINGVDRAIESRIIGAVAALQNEAAGDFELVLVGNPALIQATLDSAQYSGPDVRIEESKTVVGMGTRPSKAVQMTDSSLTVSTRIAHETNGAIVTAGNSGAAVLQSVDTMGLIKGIKVPFIGQRLPKGQLALDLGASPGADSDALVQYGIVGSGFMEIQHDIPLPIVRLMNMGPEDTKGGMTEKIAHHKLKRADINFHGNMEGSDLYDPRNDVIVIDGLTGNVLIKAIKATLAEIQGDIRAAFQSSPRAMLGGLLSKPAISSGMKEKWNYSKHGGGRLFGIDGDITVCHGTADEVAITQAVLDASRTDIQGFNASIPETLEGNRAFTSRPQKAA